MRVLCVAEKPSIARSISQILSGGRVETRATQNRFIKNFDFDYPQTNSHFTVTSVSGHLLAHDFPDAYRQWHSCDPLSLFDAPIHTIVPTENKAIERNLMNEVRSAHTLMIWTDCDREGENIGWEIVTVCRKAKPNILVRRARFSAIIPQQIHRAAQQPVDLDLGQADAVEARILLDLRIGAAFTRMQTLALQNRLPQFREKREVVSYGPCQFPTLGFVVQRYNQVKAFTPEDFWYIILSLNRQIDGEDKKVDFTWRRGHLFEVDVVNEIYEDIMENPRARVTKVTQKNTKKWKPLPLTTVELQKAGSRLLKLAPKKVLDIAEKLYQQGFLSYPRTETDQYDPQFDFMTLIGKQTVDPSWGAFATSLRQGGFTPPRRGKNNDKAHPPIHPTAHNANLGGDEKKVYDFITRRFLASCSKDAEGSETTVDVVYGGEEFYVTGLIILARNYLDVYPYDKWTGKEIPDFREGEEFKPTSCENKEGRTTSPTLLTEADLVTLMDKNGIGTDATIAQHIQTIVDREYVIERMDGATKHLLPSTLGIGLVEGYNQIGFDRSLSKPQLRRETERSMVQVCEGAKTKNEMLVQSIEQYKDMYVMAKREFEKVIESVRRYIEGAGGRNARNDEGNGGPGRGGGGGAPRGGGGRGNHRGDSDDGDGAPGGHSRGHGAAPRAPRRPPPPLSNVDDIGPPQSRQETAPRAGLSNCSSSSQMPKCDCGIPASKKRVTQKSAREGKQFYACLQNACGFFKWIEGEHDREGQDGTGPTPLIPAKRAIGASRSDQAVTPARQCRCKEDAVQRTVTKEGVNKGRLFWGCTKGKEEGCGFFEWDDEPTKSPGSGPPTSKSARTVSRNDPPSSGKCFKAVFCIFLLSFAFSTLRTDMPPSTKESVDADAINNEKDFAVVDDAKDVVGLSSVERARLLRKIDWYLLPLVSLLYLLSFLDRSNVGNAKVAGMSTDLDLVGLRYNTAAAIFFVLYSLAEVPSNIILKLFRPSRWIPTIMVAWGLIMTLMCLVNTYQGLLAARVFLGLTEAGLFPGVTYYISLWYPRADRAMRIAIFFSAATVAGAFGGILAYAIEKMDGIGNLHGWQWIFCLEGLVTVIVAFGAFFFMHDYPETASFLTETERRNIIELLKNDSQNLATHYDFEFVLQALKDYKTYIQIGIYIGLLVPVYAIALFTPTIINELGFSAADAQLLSVPPFVAGCVCTILVGIYSDIHKLRGPYVIAGAFVSLVGYIILYTQTSAGASYAGALLAAVGVFPTIAVDLAWAGSNAGGDMKRGVVIAMVIGLGNLGG
ncbi:DNA topoisomerase [Butyriboletus roseoflavus]|nr:DNA topoisomerase [Butyriboletus roseoflavus]